MNALLVWLVDASVVSKMMRPWPELRAVDFLDSVANEGLDFASIPSGKFSTASAVSRRQNTLFDRFQDLLDELFEDRVVDWTLADLRECARTMEDKRSRCEPIDDHDPDAFLAAAAASRGLAAVTRNTREVRGAEVETVDPWTAEAR